MTFKNRQEKIQLAKVLGAIILIIILLLVMGIFSLVGNKTLRCPDADRCESPRGVSKVML
jgi:CHASE1-domain containing sensor protein